MTISMKDFEEHLENNPHIYPMFKKFALEAAKYRDVFSASAIIQRIRWDTALYENDSKFKLANHWSPFYAKKFMEEHPEHKGFFKQYKNFDDIKHLDEEL